MAMNFCPQCGHRLVPLPVEERIRPVCDSASGGCGYIDFGPYSLGAGGLVVSEQNGEKRILLIERNQEPNRGGWTIPGGFVEWNEPAHMGVIREVAEETGICCEMIGLAGFRNRPDPSANNSYAVFLLKPVGGQLITQPSAEIAAAGYYGLTELDGLARLAPLSRALAVAALTGTLVVLHAVEIPTLQNPPAYFTLFMG